jgi:tetratricopeptide (TPR) repeat protein
MFWRRSRKEKEEVEETDDLAKLQKQFGITPIQDADVQAELQALLAAMGGSLSPKDESLELVGQDDDDDEEARILRELQLDGVALSDDESASHRAESELRGVLQDAHDTARMSRRREELDMTPAQPQQNDDRAELQDREALVHALKVEAVELKRQGRIQEALAKFREAKQLQERGSSGSSGLKTAVGVARTEENVQPSVEPAVVDGDHDVEVTDEDMQDPEFLAQLATMGLTEEKVEAGHTEPTRYHDIMQQLAALETQIHECKLQAVQLKRQNRIAEALSCMRKMKELEAERDELRSSSMISTPVPVIQTLSVPQVTESVYHSTAANTSTVVRSNSGVDENGFDDDSGSIEDVEVTAEDMNDPAFAQELQHLNGASTLPTEGASTELPPVPRVIPDQVAAAKTTLLASRSFRNAPSIDEDDLIDAFDDESDSEEETNHLSSVMSSGSLRSGIRSLEMENSACSAEKKDTKAEMETNHIADLSAKLQKAKLTALSLKRKGDIQGALGSLRRAKQIENLIGLKQQAAGISGAASSSSVESAYAAKFQEVEQLLVDFGNRSMMAAKENMSVNREKASEWLSKVSVFWCCSPSLCPMTSKRVGS